MKTPEEMAEECPIDMEQKASLKAASPENVKRWRQIENNRRMDARYRLLSAILNAAENNELCNTLWDDQLLTNIREDIRTTVSEWMNMSTKEKNENT